MIEFVLYWGRRRWKGSCSFQKLFQNGNFPENAWKYIDSLTLHVFEMRYLPAKTRKLFQNDMRIIVDYLAEGNHYSSQRKIVHKAALIKMISVLSGDIRISHVEKWMKEQGIRGEDEITVCELFNQYVRQGRTEGRAEGKTEGENRLACRCRD